MIDKNKIKKYKNYLDKDDFTGFFNQLGSMASEYAESFLVDVGIDFLSTMSEIPDGLFEGCNRIRTINIPASIKTIGEGAFEGCANLTAVNMADSVKTVGKGAFANCTNLQNVKLSNNITKLRSQTFKNCESLNEIYLPVSVVDLDKNIFDGISEIKIITEWRDDEDEQLSVPGNEQNFYKSHLKFKRPKD